MWRDWPRSRLTLRGGQAFLPSITGIIISQSEPISTDAAEHFIVSAAFFVLSFYAKRNIMQRQHHGNDDTE